MRTALLILLIALPVAAAAHPGKTDRHGGHQCLKDCAEWDLYYREYHTHDKDGRPVRIAKKKPVASPPRVAPGMAPPSEVKAVNAPEAPAAPRVPRTASVIPAEPDSPVLPWFLIAVLLLLLLSIRRRERKTAGK